MLKSDLVPNFIEAEPPVLLKITYPNFEDVEVKFGTEFQPSSVIQPPKVSWPVDKDDTSLYTLSMMDPDSKPVQTNHWLVVNIPGTDIEKGQLVAPYSGPKPPRGTGTHRYVFSVYRQPNLIPELPTVSSVDERHAETLKEFVDKFQLGDPVAGNFITAQPDQYSINFWKDFKFT